MNDAPVIHTQSLCKNYGPTEALRGLDLSVPRGSLCGFLGRNGAGKTTTLKILMGLARPTSGHAEVFGLPCDSTFSSLEIRTRAAFITEAKSLFPYMTVDQVIAFTQVCQVVELDTAIALGAAEACREHRLATADAIIFATARARGATLLTCDSHFEGLPGVTLIEKVRS